MAIRQWFPHASYKDLGPDGGPYDEIAHPKCLWHTTEGNSLEGAEAAFRNYPPHIGYDPRIRDLRQYVKMDRHAYALAGSEADDECIFQIELVGFANSTHTWPDWYYDNIRRDLIIPFREIYGVPDQHLRFYGADEGIVLASKDSPIRLSLAQLRSFSGHLGHQHAPAPDAHWDPGRLLLDKVLSYAEDDMTPEEHNWLATVYQQITGDEDWSGPDGWGWGDFVDGTTRTPVDLLRIIHREIAKRYTIEGRPVSPDLDDTLYGHLLSTRAEIQQVSTGSIDLDTLADKVADKILMRLNLKQVD